ncbi:histidinol-phosphate aminotransferase family protein [Niabella sp. CC-SYL272]|uniref:pyridoxal phosphate-dependent aminotransferase n=1 Tax=Niabella agricola TaxID=2891571 RepID=UPI001F451614|nr:histidinol-phosphate transaminase [Niabella agricola]MCF3109239.1 histidinol-phosphate aminotransferase family protein [Niabella agricola]
MMQTNRRTWLQQIGIVTAGFSVAPFKALALPSVKHPTVTTTADQAIRLSSNENPYGPSPLAREAMARSIGSSNRYNWNTAEQLMAALAQKNQVTEDNILIAAGSTVILDLVVQSFAAQGGNFIVPHPSYTNWTKRAEQLGLEKRSIPLTPAKQLPLDAMLAAMNSATRMIYVCNPNNPTGTLCEHNALLSFIKTAAKKATVIVDEAYIDFTDQPSVSHLVAENKNLIVVRTFSKIYGLAGARTGYAIAHKDTISRISALQTWANGDVSVVSRAAALASLSDTGFVKQCYAQNIAVRKYTIEQLTRLGITCIPSHTNFIYFSLAGYKKDFFGVLKNNNIQGTFIYEADGQWTRITVGTLDEMQRFISVIQ